MLLLVFILGVHAGLGVYACDAGLGDRARLGALRVHVGHAARGSHTRQAGLGIHAHDV
jgi:hypothetical protein